MPWTNITNAQLAVGSPIRSIDLLALRDNIIAQANGDAGAPQQQTAGIADNAITAAKVNKGNGIGTSGTQLVVACPTHNTVGSYVFIGVFNGQTNSNPFAFGGNYAAGAGAVGMQAGFMHQGDGQANIGFNNQLSGTWKWMSGTCNSGVESRWGGLGCRVS